MNGKALLICFVGGTFVLYQFLLQGSTSLMVPDLVQSLCVDLSKIGFLSSAFFYPYILLQIPSGMLADRFGSRKVLLISTLMLGAGAFAFSISGGFISADISRIIMGAASAPGVACAMSLAARWYPKKFILVAGIIEMMGMIGGAVGDYVLSLIIHDHGWRFAMMICAAMGMVLFIAIFLIVCNRPKIEMVVSQEFQTRDSVNNEFWSHLKSILVNKEIWKVCLYGGLIFTIISAFASLWAIPFFSTLYSEMSRHAISKATALIFIGAAIGAGMSGFLTNKLPSKIIKIIFSLAATVSFASILFIHVSFEVMEGLCLILGICSGTYILPFASVEANAPKEAKGLAMGFTNMVIIGIGGPIFQPVIGWMINVYDASSFGCGMKTIASFQFSLMPILIGLIVSVFLSFSMKNRG